MWKPTSLFLATLLVVDSFLVAYAVGLNSRHVKITRTLPVLMSSIPAPAPAPAPSAPIATSKPADSFTDLTATESRLQSSLSRAAEAGILDPTQDKKFRPNDPVTRADFTRWMVRVRQIPTETPEAQTYSDVDPANSYYKDIEGASKAMMVQGYTTKDKTQKEFKPEQFITRQEFAVMYGTFSGKRGRAETLDKDGIEKYLTYNPSTSAFEQLTYKDVGDVDDWARKWVAVAHQAGVLEQCFDINPYASTDDKKYLHPQQKMTRAEAVNILVKLYGIQSRNAVADGATNEEAPAPEATKSTSP